MGLTSARDTPRQELPQPVRTDTPNTPTPSGLLDTLKKSTNQGTGLKEQERMMEDLKKEIFDYKLRCYHLEDMLRKSTPSNMEAIFNENDSLKAANEALVVEIRSLKDILNEAHHEVEKAKRNRNTDVNEHEELQRLRHELDLTTSQLNKSFNTVKSYEHQLELFDQESRETLKRTKQLEMELAAANRKVAEISKVTEEQKKEIVELQDELNNKNVFVQQVKEESQSVHSELELLMRQKQELESKLRIVENERDNIRSELDPARRRILENLTAPGTPGSPRSSMDLIESRMLKQMGNTAKQLEMMTKTTAIVQSEKDQLMEQNKRMAIEINGSIRKIMALLEKITKMTGLLPKLTDNNMELIVDEVIRLCESVLIEYDDNRRQKEAVIDDLKQAHEELATMKHQLDRAKDQARLAKEQLSLVEKESHNNEALLQKAESHIMSLEQQLKAANEIDLPKYREHTVHLQNAVNSMETDLVAKERQIAELKNSYDSMRRRCLELESELARQGADFSSRHDELIELRKQKQELLQKLTLQEDHVSQIGKKLDETRQQLLQLEKTKQTMEESFSKELKTLHGMNGELKAQLTAATSGKTTNDQRLERLQASLRFVEQSNDELVAKLQTKDTMLSGLAREKEILLVEKQTLEREINEIQGSLQRAENEISRLKRMDVGLKRSHEGMEHLQHKIESLASLNALLKEQLEVKDRNLRESEEKLRRQDEAIRKAYVDCDAQAQKIKKREMVISRVLKRLENLNAVTGINGLEDDLSQA